MRPYFFFLRFGLPTKLAPLSSGIDLCQTITALVNC
ncbi:MAG: hypothetical protein ACI9G1_004987, partial [Pirellulaceae bacterium]